MFGRSSGDRDAQDAHSAQYWRDRAAAEKAAAAAAAARKAEASKPTRVSSSRADR